MVVVVLLLLMVLLLVVIYIYNDSTLILDISSLLLLLLLGNLLGRNDGPRWVMDYETSPVGARGNGHGLWCCLYCCR